MNNFLLSILVPTKSRQAELKYCLRSLKKMPVDSVEIIVCDNSPTDEAKSIFEEEGLMNNFKYIHIPNQIPISDNFGNAISIATGEYITMIGDDDTVHGKIDEVVKWMKANGVDGLTTTFAEYYWPGVKFKYYGNRFSGALLIHNHEQRCLKIIAQEELNRCLSVGCTDLGRLPRMYYGIVKRSFLEEIKAIAGVYIPGPSPDMANAVSLSLVMQKYLYCSLPIFIAGNSSKSGGGMGASKKHIGDLNNKPWLPQDIVEKWSKYIPMFWSGPTIWCESALKAINRMNQSRKMDRWNGHYLHAKCDIFHAEYRSEIITSYENFRVEFKQSSLISMIKYRKAFLHIWFLRLKSLSNKVTLLLPFVKSFVSTFRDIQNVEDAGLVFDKEVEITKVLTLLRKYGDNKKLKE